MSKIVSRVTIDGVHCWPSAPNRVAFLREPHRHLFYIEAQKEVRYDDRDIEFIEFGGQIISYLASSYPAFPNPNRLILDFGSSSCEVLAKAIAKNFGLSSCAVYEDNENGAIYSEEK